MFFSKIRFKDPFENFSHANSFLEKKPIFAKTPIVSLLYIFTGTILQWSYGLSSNIVQANILPLADVYHVTPLEMTWLVAAYMAPNVSLSIILVKLRMQYGLRIFAQLSIILFLLGSLLNSFVFDFESALLVRFLCGIVASPISSLAFLYIIEAFPPEKKFTVALSINLMNVSLATPLSRIISPIFLQYYGPDGLYFCELGLVFLAFIGIFLLPLTLAPKQKLIEITDFYSYMLIALGLGLNAIILLVSPYYGWNSSNWIGVSFILIVICLLSAALIELHRDNPLINLRWLFSREMIQIAFVLFMFRILLSEQSTIITHYFNVLGFQDEMIIFAYCSIALGVLIGGTSCIFFYRSGREDLFHIIALIFLALGAYIDMGLSNSSSLSRIYFGQFFLGCGGAMFMPPSLSRGFAKALASGQKYVISFIAVFLVTQSTGGLIGSTFFTAIAQIYHQYFYQKIIPKSSWDSAYMQNKILEKSQTLSPFTTDENLRALQAKTFLDQEIQEKSDVFAYNEVFEWYFYIAVFVLSFLIIKVIYQYIKYQKLKTAWARSRFRQAKKRRSSFKNQLKNADYFINKWKK